MLGVVDEDLQHEPVDLGFRQRVRPLRLDRVLRRHHEEGIGDGVGRMRDRDLVLLHDFEQGALHLRRRAVDLVGEQEVAEHRAELGVEASLPRAVDACPDQVRGHEIRRELHACERAPEHPGGRLDGEGLGESGDTFDQ